MNITNTQPQPGVPLRARTVPVSTLSPQQCRAMWSLFANYYDNVGRETFQRDLDSKSDVILLEEATTGQLRGFSTLKTDRGTIDGRAYRIVFSGDTIVDASCWGQKALHRAFVAYLFRQYLSAPWTPLYWLLITKGYKTYLLLTRNFPVHWPRHDRPTPARQQNLRNDIAARFFGTAWQPALGIVRHPTCQGRLKEDVAPPQQASPAPDIAYFCQRNPHHTKGDELVCLGRFNLWMLCYFSARLLRRATRALLRAKPPGAPPQHAGRTS